MNEERRDEDDPIPARPTRPAERPILFSDAMVQAIIAGRKRVTRRVVTPMPGRQSKWLTMDTLAKVPRGHMTTQDGDGRPLHGWQMEHPRGGPGGWIACPYAAEALWVREAWAPTTSLDGERAAIAFRSGGPLSMLHPDHWRPVERWRPSIHLRRVNARITLHGIAVRVERLHDIDEADAMAEGAEPRFEIDLAGFVRGAPVNPTYRIGFKHLWRSINDRRPGCGWDANPWCWRVAWERAEVRT